VGGGFAREIGERKVPLSRSLKADPGIKKEVSMFTEKPPPKKNPQGNPLGAPQEKNFPQGGGGGFGGGKNFPRPKKGLGNQWSSVWYGGTKREKKRFPKGLSPRGNHWGFACFPKKTSGQKNSPKGTPPKKILAPENPTKGFQKRGGTRKGTTPPFSKTNPLWGKTPGGEKTPPPPHPHFAPFRSVFGKFGAGPRWFFNWWLFCFRS